MKITVPVLFLLLGILICKAPYTLQDCDRPNLNPNVVIDPDQNSYITWSQIDISCDDGFSISGPDYSYCYDGPPPGSPPDSPDYWSPAITATCSGQCSAPVVDDDVIISPSENLYSPGSIVGFSCGNGTLSGSSQGTCQSDGTWDIPTDPECLDMCPAPLNLNGTGPYDHNANVVFTCNAGYKFDSSADMQLICVNGSWNPPVECVFGGCLAPDTPSNVNYTSSSAPEGDIYEVNSKVLLSCADDMTPFGPEFSYCNSSGDWEPSPFLLQCFAKCVAPSFDDPRISHSSIYSETSTSPSYYDSSDTIAFTCGGRFVQGPRRATCQEGVWSPNIEYKKPICRDNCTAPLNTDINNGEGAIYLHGQAEIFKCINKPGMVRLGGPRAFCNDGTWKPNVLCKLKTEL